jgi:hypothetical protein
MYSVCIYVHEIQVYMHAFSYYTCFLCGNSLYTLAIANKGHFYFSI